MRDASGDEDHLLGQAGEILIEVALVFDKSPRHRIVWRDALTNFIADHNYRAGGLGESRAKRATSGLNIPLGHHEIGQPKRDAIEEHDFVRLCCRQSLHEIQRRLNSGPIGPALQAVLRDFCTQREAISNIVIKNLKPLSITERPVHFKDKKQWYIKDEEDGWNEDNGDKLMQAASFGIQRNWSKEFEKEYPTWKQNEKLRDLYVKLAGTSCSDVTEREKLNILKNLADACNLPKNVDKIGE